MIDYVEREYIRQREILENRIRLLHNRVDELTVMRIETKEELLNCKTKMMNINDSLSSHIQAFNNADKEEN